MGEFNFQNDKDISNQKEPPVANNIVWIPIFIDRYIDWYNDRGGYYQYSHSVLSGSRMEYIAIGTGAPSNPYNQEHGSTYHDHHGGSISPSNPVDNHPVEIINKLTGKAKCVYDRLESLNGNLFKETIGAFIDDPKYNLTLQLGNCTLTNDACTDSNDPMNIVITLEDVNQSSLGIAGLILHEAIHAEMHRYVSRFESGIDPNNRARLFQLYKYYKDLELNTGEIQHIYMTENYIIPIAKALRSLDGNRYHLDYYKSFAWDGLRLWDANELLSMEMDSIYYSYRNIVINNSILNCD